MAATFWRPALRVALFLFGAVLGGQSDELALKSQRASELMAAGRFADAVPMYEELCRALPGNAGLRLNLGLALHMAGRGRESIPHFEAVLRSEPGNFPALLSLGSVRLELNQPAQAIAPLGKAVTLGPSDKNARGMLANALLSVNRPGEAAVHFRKLTTLAADDPRAWYGLGRSYEGIAGRAFEELGKMAPGSGYWFALVAESRSKQRQARSAFYFTRKAVEKAPRLRGLHAALAAIYRQTGHADWAAEEERRERALGPPDCAAKSLECEFAARRFIPLVTPGAGRKTPETFYWQARAASELARDAFARLESLPESVEGHQLLAELHRDHDRHVEAVKEWEAALRLAPGDASLEQELAAARYLAKDYAGAQQLLDRLLPREPDSPELNFLQGDVLLNLQQAEKAIPFLEKATRRDPKNLHAHAAMARAYAQTGQGASALPHLKAALPIDDDGSLHFQIARAYQAAGQAELAKEFMGKYQEIRKKLKEAEASLEEEAQITPP